jgi:hypothetical protein
VPDEGPRSSRGSVTRVPKVIHDGHYVKPISEVLAQANQDRYRLNNELKEHEDRIEEAASYFKGMAQLYEEQRNLFLSKVT